MPPAFAAAVWDESSEHSCFCGHLHATRVTEGTPSLRRRFAAMPRPQPPQGGGPGLGPALSPESRGWGVSSAGRLERAAWGRVTGVSQRAHQRSWSELPKSPKRCVIDELRTGWTA